MFIFNKTEELKLQSHTLTEQCISICDFKFNYHCTTLHKAHTHTSASSVLKSSSLILSSLCFSLRVYVSIKNKSYKIYKKSTSLVFKEYVIFVFTKYFKIKQYDSQTHSVKSKRLTLLVKIPPTVRKSLIIDIHTESVHTLMKCTYLNEWLKCIL